MALAAITDYPSLVANVSDFMARTDLEYAYPTWILNAEKRMNSALKAPGMEFVATLTLDAEGTGDIPTDYIEWLTARWKPTGGGTRAQYLRNVEANSDRFTIRFRPNGDPQFYTVVGGKVRVVPARTGTLDLTYYRTIPPLTSAAPTNWLITRAPHLYLYSVLSEGYLFQKDEEKAAEWAKAADERLQLFILESGGAKVGRRADRAAQDADEAFAAKAVS